MNVKPGDIAKCLDPQNAGALVTVLCAADQRYYDGFDWEVLAMQDMTASDPETGEQLRLVAGHRLATMDKNLKRVDPFWEDETLQKADAPDGIRA